MNKDISILQDDAIALLQELISTPSFSKEEDQTALILEIFLNAPGPRVYSSKTQGLFRKFARPKGYVLIWTLGSVSDGSE